MSAYVTSAIVPLTETSHMAKLAVSVGGGYYSKGMESENCDLTTDKEEVKIQGLRESLKETQAKDKNLMFG